MFRKKEYLKKFIKELIKYKIEYRPIISGNLVLQPFLRKVTKKKFNNSNFIHNNGVYLGNNQFVGQKKLFLLKKILNKCFSNF